MTDDKIKVKCDKCHNLKPICYTGRITLCSDCFREVNKKK